MNIARPKSRRGKNGVVKIQRSNYNTKDGFQVKNSWYSVHDSTRTKSKGKCDVKGCVNPGSEPHHIVPLTRGGTNHPSNLIYLCKTCHNKRHNHLFRSR